MAEAKQNERSENEMTPEERAKCERHADEVALRIMRRRAAETWIKTLPMDCGRYWHRRSAGMTAHLVEVVLTEAGFHVRDDLGSYYPLASYGGQWAGPLTPPE